MWAAVSKENPGRMRRPGVAREPQPALVWNPGQWLPPVVKAPLLSPDPCDQPCDCGWDFSELSQSCQLLPSLPLLFHPAFWKSLLDSLSHQLLPPFEPVVCVLSVLPLPLLAVL